MFIEFICDRGIQHIENHKIEEDPDRSVNDFNQR